MLNREVRTISRVIIDPRFRGLGLAVKLVRHALANPCAHTAYTEALAAMGRMSPFFERAGMIRYERPLHAAHARLIDALERVAIAPAMLGCDQIIRAKMNELDRADRAWLDAELRRWHRSAFRIPNRRIHEYSLKDRLHAARDVLLARPVYYIHRHA